MRTPLARVLGMQLLLAAALLMPSRTARAIDCRQPGTPIDRAVCASPTLLARDAALNAAFAAAMARDEAGRPALLAGQRDWLRRRARDCAGQAGAALASCIERSIAGRIAALGATASLPAHASVPNPVAPPPVPPMPAFPPVATPPAAAMVVAGPQALPGIAMLAQDDVPAVGITDTPLTVTRSGRFTLRAESATGTAIQLIDQLTGPGDVAGLPGALDGRLDLLLEAGVYRLRSFGAAGGADTARLRVSPFHEAAPPILLRQGERLDATLADGEQRSAWVVVTERGPLRIDAAGRALADIALWRDGRSRVPLALRAGTIAPRQGRSLTSLVATPVLEPGSYRVTAYGGPARAWAEAGTEQPLHLRLGGADGFAEGWIAGRVGPFGSEVFAVPGQQGLFRLELPVPAPASLSVATGEAATSAAIAANSRHAVTTLAPGPRRDTPRLIAVSGAEGQPFTLRGFGAATPPLQEEGRYLLLAELPAHGGDGPPPSLVLARQATNQPPALLAGIGPRIGPGEAWRARFNITGAIRLAVQVTAPGPVTLRTEGVAVTPSLQQADGTASPGRADGTAVTRWDLAAGWHVLRIMPQPGASGVLELALGPPGQEAPLATSGPSGPVLPLGEHALAAGQRFILTGDGASLVTRRLPLDLDAAPLTLTLAAGEGFAAPVAIPAAGSLHAVALDGSTVQAEITPGQQRTLRIAPASVARTVLIAWRRPAPSPVMPRPAPPEALPVVGLGAPHRLSLGRDGEATLTLRLPSGGLYRLESTGRLRVAARLGTDFQPQLDGAEANGPGQNMLIQRHLRAGEYRLAVTARETAGRLGVLVRPAPLREAPPLAPGGIARAGLAAGEGLALPLHVAEAGMHRIETLSLGRPLHGRLEDAEGWPVLPAGELGVVEADLRPGAYRLVVAPADVDGRVIARFTRPAEAPPTEGHGPHPLAFGRPAQHLWREPAPGAPRMPDRWRFDLAGPADVTLAIGDGMAATLQRRDAAAAGRVAGFAGGAPFAGALPAGSYEIEAQAIGRNDRLDYALTLDSEALQPGAPRQVTLPATLPFALAEDRIVSLSTFGGTALRAVLRDADGHEVAREEGDAEDWNLAMSRPLPAGRYSLELAGLGPATAPPERRETSDDAEEDAERAQRGTMPGTEEDEADAAPIELHLALPALLPARPLPSGGEALLQGGGVHRLALPAPAPGTLLLARAEAGRAVVLSLERREGDGSFSAIGIARGPAPLLAVPGEAAGEWRLSAWAAEGGDAPIRLRVATAQATAQDGPHIVPQEGVAGFGRFLALVALPSEVALRLSASAAMAGTAPGVPLAPASILLPQSRRLWLMTPDATPITLAPVTATPAAPLVLSLAPGAVATLPPAPAPRLWIASGGQPWMEAGRGGDAGVGSALALAGEAPLRVGAGAAGMRLALRAVDPVLLPPRPAPPDGLRLVLPPGTAQAVDLPVGGKQVRLDLAPGTAAILGWRAAGAVTAWTGAAALSRTLEGAWEEVLLVNTGEDAAPVALVLASPGPAPLALSPGRALRLLPGTPGSIDLPVHALPGQALRWAGASAGRFTGVDGQVATTPGTTLNGPGRLVLVHDVGPLIAWLDGPGTALFPEAPPQTLALPSRIVLAGDVLAGTLDPGAPALVSLRTTAPAVLALGDAPPLLFPAGAVLQRAVVGPTRLRLMAPLPGPLSGLLDISAAPPIPIGEGVAEPVMVGPGGAALFGFAMPREATIGIGLRAEPDRAALRLLDEHGRLLGEGMALHRRLPPGRYLIETRVPMDAPATRLRPALLGIDPPPEGPPPEVVRVYQPQPR